MPFDIFAPLVFLSAPAIAEDHRSAMPAPATVLAEVRRVADWQLANRTNWSAIPAGRPSVRNPRGWEQATFWVALSELASRDNRYKQALVEIGRAEHWRLGDRPFHADDQLIGQAWLWAAANGEGERALTPTRQYFDFVLANPPRVNLEFIPKDDDKGTSACTDRWCWCDALFMAPATLIQLSVDTGDRRYADFAHEEFRNTTDYLYDVTEDLYFRDSRFFDMRDGQGRKLFWSRGNGWVMAGLVRILNGLNRDDPHRAYYEGLFRKMAAKLLTLQRPDGYWSPSLLDNSMRSPKETSGTAFFTFAFAWGVRSGLLETEVYEPAAIRGWNALGRAVNSEGMLGWVQQVGDRPDSVSPEETQFFGTGAYLLAGTAIYDLAVASEKSRR